MLLCALRQRYFLMKMVGRFIMILCDIGNSNADFYQDGRVWSLSHKQFKDFTTKETVYYICVNDTLKYNIGGDKND